MAKNLSERIAERMRNKKASVGAQNRGAFLALKSEIAQAISDGWPIKSIWETLHEEGKVKFSYQAFRNYVNSLLLGGKQAGTPPAKAEAAVPQAIQDKPAKPPVPAKQRANEPRANPTAPQPEGFNFDAKPNKEDFL
ncbi:TraK family protein (plasmid) [Pseudomonas sp. WOUb67]|uniref:TraK family protein n=1 Tax=Pseudomonas sp. WOUb67 TaxID=3161136 RepID=UPI003CF5941D